MDEAEDETLGNSSSVLNENSQEKIVEEPVKKKRPYNRRKKVKLSEDEINF